AVVGGGCRAGGGSGVVGASVVEVEQLATGAAVDAGGVVGWHACPPWCTSHYTGRGEVFERGEDLHTGTTYTLNGVSTCRGVTGDSLSVYLDRLDADDQPAGAPVVWLSSRRTGECWRLTAAPAPPPAAPLDLSAPRALGGRGCRT